MLFAIVNGGLFVVTKLILGIPNKAENSRIENNIITQDTKI
jgi:hypothetical protein